MTGPGYSADDLGRALRDALVHVAADGWQQPPSLFALVSTAALAQANPGLVDPDDDSALSPIAQDPLEVGAGDEPYGRLESFLATLSWPDGVAGAALVTEILVLPPNAETDLDTAFEPLLADPDAGAAAARSVARSHPDARTARLAVGALRDGPRLALMYLRPDDSTEGEATAVPAELLTHPDMAPNLQEALAATFDPDVDSPDSVD
ncbi:PPA1309 family protein [Gordonia sinesedis]